MSACRFCATVSRHHPAALKERVSAIVQAIVDTVEKVVARYMAEKVPA